jgi:polyisoprenoid-binding protein YceI
MSIRTSALAAAVSVLGLVCVSPVGAQQAAAYTVDPARSAVFAKVSSATRIGHPHGVQGMLKSGTIGMTGTGDLVIDMTTFQADTAAARRYVGLPEQASDADKVTANMRGPDVLDVNKYPTATFTLTALKPTDGQAVGQPGQYRIDGKFTLHGMTRPVAINANLMPAEKPGEVRMVGAFTILQSGFGIKPYSALGGLARVADPLLVYGDLRLVPAR